MTVAKIYISGRITKGETLIDVIRQYKSFEAPTEVLVEIESNGGNKDEGNAVHDYLKNIDSEIPVTTQTKKAYSIAAKIFAAGSKRIVVDSPEVIGVHFARVTPKGDFTAEQMQEITDELFSLKKEFIDYYSEHLDIDKETVENLLENETVLSGEEAVELGFATELENKVAEIVAELNIENSNINKMTEKKKSKTFLKLMADISAYIEEKLKVEVNAELTLQDSSATDIVFPDLEVGDTPKVGDKATIDGKAIPDESYIMPSLEDVTLVFVGGEVSEVLPKEVEETEEEVEARLKAEEDAKTEVKAETEGLEISTWSMRLVNDTFAEGDILKYLSWEDEECLVSTAEVKIPDGRTVVTDAAGVIVKVKEADSPAQVLETEASFEDLKVKMTEKIKTEVKAEIKAEHEAELAVKDTEIKALKKKKGSKEFNAEGKDTPSGVTEKTGAARYLQAAKNL